MTGASEGQPSLLEVHVRSDGEVLEEGFSYTESPAALYVFYRLDQHPLKDGYSLATYIRMPKSTLHDPSTWTFEHAWKALEDEEGAEDASE